MSRTGARLAPCRARCCRRRWASRCCPTFPTGRGMNTACARASGVSSKCAAIADTIAAIKAFTGQPPRGWESPGLTETDDTLDLLAEAGIEYVADWVLDEQPVLLKTTKGE